MKSISFITLIFALLLSCNVFAQQPYALTAGVLLQRGDATESISNNFLFGATIDYGFFSNCTVINCTAAQGSKIIFSGNNQVVDGSILEEGATLIMDTSSGDVYGHGHIGANVVVLNGTGSEGMVTLNSTNGLGDTIDLRGFSSVNCFYGTKHLSISDEYFRSFIGGDYALIDVNDSIGVGIINHSAKYGHHFYSGSSSPDTVDVDSLGIRISKLNTAKGVLYMDATGRVTQTAPYTTVGINFLTLTNPSAVTFIRVNADNSLSTRTAAQMLSDLGAGSGTVTSVATGYGLSGGAITATGTLLADTSILVNKTGVQTLTNKTMSGSLNTFTNIPFSAVTGLGSMAKADSVSFHGNTNITTLGTIGTGTWNANVIAASKVATDSIPFYYVNGTQDVANKNTGAIGLSCGTTFSVVTPTYVDGMLGISETGSWYIGDHANDNNGTSITGNDAAQTITVNAGNGTTFNGSFIANGGFTIPSFTINGGILTTDSSGNVLQLTTGSSHRYRNGINTLTSIDLTQDVANNLPTINGGSGRNDLTYPDTVSQVMGAIFKRVTGKTAATTVQVHGVGASDGSFIVSANILVTTATLHNFTATVTYTDEGSTSRTLTLQFSTLAGAFITAMTNAQGTVPYEGVPLHIRCKASTNITIATVGTFTGVTYNFESSITKIN